MHKYVHGDEKLGIKLLLWDKTDPKLRELRSEFSNLLAKLEFRAPV